MNGVHDLGGMHGFGAVQWQEPVPPPLDQWEAAVIAMNRVGRAGIWNIDEFRHAIERMGNAEYLNTSYFEHWLACLETLVVEKGLFSEDQLAERRSYFEQHPEAPARAAAQALPGQQPFPAREGHPYLREPVAPRFQPGDTVVARRIAPRGHTRLPRYIRGCRGTVMRCHGTHVFPDTNAHGLGERPQPLYSVRFDAAELWGEQAEGRSSVYIDLWQEYLLPG